MNHVLIVDDREETNAQLSAWREIHGWMVGRAHQRQGAEVPFTRRRSIPELALSDLLTPVTVGFTLPLDRKSERHPRHIPLAVHPATQIEPGYAPPALSPGADAFPSGPANPDSYFKQAREIQPGRAASAGAVPLEIAGEGNERLRKNGEALVRKLDAQT